MNTKVSVIVPVYNVKQYIDQCLDSLLHQDYADYEVILVDDGSTDGSGTICDAVAGTNDNVKVIHQENQGLSAARNSGTAVATGEYVAYVDSDDWVAENYISYQMKLALAYDADIVTVRQQSMWNGSKLGPTDYSIEKVERFNTSEAMEEICYGDKMGFSACKLFRKEIVKKYSFPEGALYEDLAVMYKIFGDAKYIVYSNLPLYFYRRREGSIKNGKFDKRHLCLIDHANQMYEFVEKNYPDLLLAAGYRCAYSATELAPMIISANDRAAFELIQAQLNKHFRAIVHNKRVRMKYKVRGFAIKLGMGFARTEFTVEKQLKKIIKRQLYSD